MLELGAHVSARGGVDQAIGRAVDLEMTAFQIFTKNANRWTGAPIDPVVAERFRAGIDSEPTIRAVVAHASYLINLASPDDDLWARSIDALADELRRCEVLGVPYLVVHPGAHMGAGEGDGIRRVAQAIDRVHESVPEGSCAVAVETTAGQGTTLGFTFEQIAEIVVRVANRARISTCFDVCHVFAAGYDLRTEDAYVKTMAAWESTVGFENLGVVHLNDSARDLGSRRDRHAHIGQGEIGEAAFRLLLRDSRVEGKPGILETPKSDDITEDTMNLDTLRRLMRE